MKSAGKGKKASLIDNQGNFSGKEKKKKKNGKGYLHRPSKSHYPIVMGWGLER